MLYFVLKIPPANHPFVVRACNEVMHGPQNRTLDLWAREHFKSTVITLGTTIQTLLNDPTERIAIFSYTREAARVFVRQIKDVFERNELIRTCFSDIVYDNPSRESPMWTQESITLKRSGSFKEASVEAWGLIEGMPTGRHFSGRIYDDVETEDLVNTPELMEKMKYMFALSHNVGVDGGWHRVIGTHYHHEGLLNQLRHAKTLSGEPLYTVRVKPATDDGTPNGSPVLLSEGKMDELRQNKRIFYCQQLLDPTPRGEQELDFEDIQVINQSELPKNLYKFMTVDPAGGRTDKRRGDAWAMFVVGVEPFLDDVGASNIFVLDGFVGECTHGEAMKEVVDMYCRNGRIMRLGVEKVGMSSTELHVKNALAARGRALILEGKGRNLVKLSPAGRKKEQRILSNLQWPLINRKVHILRTVSVSAQERLKQEMEKFPYWHDDALDALSYVFDMLREFPFGSYPAPDTSTEVDRWERAKRRQQEAGKNSWMGI